MINEHTGRVICWVTFKDAVCHVPSYILLSLPVFCLIVCFGMVHSWQDTVPVRRVLGVFLRYSHDVSIGIIIGHKYYGLVLDQSERALS